MGCQVNPAQYAQQLADKVAMAASCLPLDGVPLSVAPSPPVGYRMRAEFRVWHEGDSWQYVMFDPQTKQRLVILDCPMVTEAIRELMQPLRVLLLGLPRLSQRLYGVDFLASSAGEVLVTLIYKAPLDDDWEQAARALVLPPHVMLMGRSRGKKRVLVQDYVTERLTLPDGGRFDIRHVENAFSQPNAAVNLQMLAWVDARLGEMGPLRSALELYGGAGNFTWVLARHADRVVMTELSRQAVAAAQAAFEAAGMAQVRVAAMDSAEVSARLAASGAGARLAWQGEDYDFDVLLVDPPRAGLDEVTCQLAARFERIVYVSCNPETLARDVAALAESHQITAAAVFDQFPYTHHTEMGVVLERR